jgi:hypothetical protein
LAVMPITSKNDNHLSEYKLTAEILAALPQ